MVDLLRQPVSSCFLACSLVCFRRIRRSACPSSYGTSKHWSKRIRFQGLLSLDMDGLRLQVNNATLPLHVALVLAPFVTQSPRPRVMMRFNSRRRSSVTKYGKREDIRTRMRFSRRQQPQTEDNTKRSTQRTHHP